MRVAEVNISDLEGPTCPGDLSRRDDTTCGIETVLITPKCSSVPFPLHLLRYSRVCGRVRAYQFGTSEAFDNDTPNKNIDNIYVDGISFTNGRPRRHIWTLAAATDVSNVDCPCNGNSQVTTPEFVGNDYFCDTGAQNFGEFSMHYGDNPLWDGAGCGPLNTCCTFNNPPWFYKELPEPTTDDIEMRVCSDDGRVDEDIAIESYDIYVQ